MGVYVGIDVSKQHLDWVLGAEGRVERTSNSPAGVRRLVSKFCRVELASIIVESTGGYERRLTEALAAADLPVILVNPWRVRDSEKVWVFSRRRTRSTRACWRCLVSEPVHRGGRYRAPGSVKWPISCGVGDS